MIAEYLFGPSKSFVSFPTMHKDAKEFVSTFGDLIHEQNTISNNIKTVINQIRTQNSWANTT
jgi:hypothetical protein